ANGFYIDNFAQWRNERILWWTVREWGEVSRGGRLTECGADSGQHGAGDASELYAEETNDGPFGGDPDDEINRPDKAQNTAYRGNNIKVLQSGANSARTRLEIVHDVTKSVPDGIDEVNVGLMRFDAGLWYILP